MKELWSVKNVECKRVLKSFVKLNAVRAKKGLKKELAKVKTGKKYIRKMRWLPSGYYTGKI
jgi:hypothetical protein